MNSSALTIEITITALAGRFFNVKRPDAFVVVVRVVPFTVKSGPFQRLVRIFFKYLPFDVGGFGLWRFWRCIFPALYCGRSALFSPILPIRSLTQVKPRPVRAEQIPQLLPAP